VPVELVEAVADPVAEAVPEAVAARLVKLAAAPAQKLHD
jgi:hypothetical protein